MNERSNIRPAAQPRQGLPAPPPHASAARIAAQRFVGVCLEVLGGHRPAHHLRAITNPADYANISDRVVRRTTRTYLGNPGRPGQRVRLIRVHVCEPRDGVAELTAVLEYGDRAWAMAARLERHGDTWLCTAVDVP